MTPSPLPAQPPAGTAAGHLPRQATPTAQRLAELRGGPDVPQRPLDARALAALAANPGCRRRALLDGAGVDKGAVAQALGSPPPFGQSQFAFIRGNAFEARVKADGGEALLALLCEHTGDPVRVPPRSPRPTWPPTARPGAPAAPGSRWPRRGGRRLGAAGPPAAHAGGGGLTAYLEPDALAVHPDGR